MHYVMKWWRDRRRQPEVRVFSAVNVDVSGPLESRSDDELSSRMREILGNKAFEGQQRLVKQRDRFKAGLANAIEVGLSGRAMAEFLNGHAFLWKHVYEKAEGDPQLLAMTERALVLCANYVPEHWNQAVKEAKENREHYAELRRKYDL
ncbi:hypothetical protein LPJ38_26870 [Bradyrhizobium daqingense]|uniref:Uncharacterized protein n=1 Tax=Bradyrhizobium daqingense TaxID=993502 RepID=A0A562LMK9_9BRAD|nr:hypothetical protein [Bradyrhizobium daqingense]TWI08841.1 hypothetical protein IQ17_01665 [Bradyrhizobium daqingense]UFS87250.1 hypothetical protein LPJ38_26870 [Bradyrhizobium daqingense]